MNIDKWGGLSYTSAASSSDIWGGNNIELLNLEDILAENTTKPSSSPGIQFKHNVILSNNQSMWCNGFFTGIITNRAQIENPYIDYTTFFNSNSGQQIILEKKQ